MNKIKIERITSQCIKEEYTQRRINNRIAKEEVKEQQEKNQKEVKEIVISIEWKKSQMWGSNPNCEASIFFKDGTFKHSPTFKASGCGYDKESTVISEVFNTYLKYTLWNLEGKEVTDKPYGISLNFDFSPSFGGGIGTTCYSSISKFIGGKFEHITSGKTFDVYKFTMNQ